MGFLQRFAKRTRRQVGKRSGEGAGLLTLSHLGVTFAASIALYTLLGLWLDRKWGVMPLFTLVGAGLGAVGGFIWLYREVLKAEERDARRAEPEADEESTES